MDADRYYAESYTKYKLYFDVLHHKINEYNVEPENQYNMDEKGFLIGVINRSTKRVFNKRQYEKKEVTQSLQAGSRKWVTVLACVCADGTAIPPGIIYEAAGEDIQSSWVDDIDPQHHSVHFTTSSTGWTNNDVGLAWLEQVFNRYTKQKSRVQYRLLILDGHGSHITMDFIKYCDDNRILLAILPPHSTQTLQPLDVACFAPLAQNYTSELTTFTQQGLGWLPVKKGDFFLLFWRAWVKSFTTTTILSSFEATGIYPPNPSRVLDRFTHGTPEAAESSDSSTSVYSGDDWLKIQSLIKAAVKDSNSSETRKLHRTLHHLSVQNQLLHHEFQGLKEAIQTKKKHNKKSITLPLQREKEYRSKVTFWSPSKRREAEERY